MSVKKRGRPKSLNPLKPVSFRFDADLLAHYRATGKGWQTRMRRDIWKIAIGQGMIPPDRIKKFLGEKQHA